MLPLQGPLRLGRRHLFGARVRGGQGTVTSDGAMGVLGNM